jgi:plastocyanin
MRRLALALALVVLAACGSDAGKKTDAAMPPKDAPRIDAARDARPVDAGVDAPQHVFEIVCPPAPAATITTNDGVDAYMPSAVTISQNGIVLFTTSNFHNVVPNPMNSDPGLNVGFAQSKCLQFTTTGTFGFHCSVHGFTGTVTVN